MGAVQNSGDQRDPGWSGSEANAENSTCLASIPGVLGRSFHNVSPASSGERRRLSPWQRWTSGADICREPFPEFPPREDELQSL